MVGSALRVNESGLFAKVSAHVVKTRASDVKFCVRATKVKFRLLACPTYDGNSTFAAKKMNALSKGVELQSYSLKAIRNTVKMAHIWIEQIKVLI